MPRIFTPNELPSQLVQELDNAILGLEKDLEREFGNPEKPLLVSVRSGALVTTLGLGMVLKY